VTAPAEPSDRVAWTVILGVASGAILVPLNSSMLAVALPGVMDEFGLGANSVSSLVSLYLGAVAIALPFSGSLGDRFGARRTFLAGVLGFAVASLVAAAAGSFLVLQLARVLQALCGALVSTSAAVLIRETSPPDRRGEAFGLFEGITWTSVAVGPFVGGVLVGAFSWRAMFFVAVPIALVAAGVVGFVVRTGDRREAEPATGGAASTSADRKRPALDIPGLVLLGLAIAALLAALRGSDLGVLGTVATVVLAPLVVAFVVVELRSPVPAVDPQLFRRPGFAAAVAGVFGTTVVLHGSFIVVPLLVERLLHESATTSGIVLLGLGGVNAIVAPFAGRASDRIGRRAVVVAGSVAMAAGLGLLWLPAGAGSAAIVAILLGVVGLGMGMAGSPRQAAAFESIGAGRIGMAAGTYYTLRYLGGVVGASVAGAVLGGTVTSSGVSLGFGILAGVAVAVAIVSVALPGRAAQPWHEGAA
jgi:EmrB/QacA subfamily drug resistance transporter